MDNRGHSSETAVKRPGGLLAGLSFINESLGWLVLTGVLIVGTIFKWLANLVLPTPEDLIEADVHLGPTHD
jgi:hypothetical protein